MSAKAPRQYSQTDVENAVEAVQLGMPIRTASTNYGVPKSTIFAKAKGLRPIEAKLGPPSVLTRDEEKLLVKWLFHSADKGFPVTRDQLLDSAKALILELGRENPFTDDRPGRHWYEGFCRRNPELSERVAQNLTYNRASATEEKLKNWFNEVSRHLASVDLLNIDPSRVFNCDETAFMLCPKAGHVIVRKGAKGVYKIVNGDEKECLTTLFMVNAAGTMVPPMIMYWYQRVPASVSQNVPKGWSIGTSERGWMTAETFYEYIANIFYPWLQENNVEFPIVLFVDGHSSHLTLPLSNFCREHQIELVALFPNATHILQPLDVAVFHPLKTAWKKAVNHWRLENNGARLKKERFAPLLKTTLDSINLTMTIKKGFETCGLSPFSVDAVDFNVLKKGQTSRTTGSSDAFENEVRSVGISGNAEKVQFFEQQLSAPLLEAFRRSEGSRVWSGETKNEGLFQIWLQMKGLAEANNQGPTENIRQFKDINSGNEVLMNETCMEMADVENLTIHNPLKNAESVTELDDIEATLQQQGSVIFNVNESGTLLRVNTEETIDNPEIAIVDSGIVESRAPEGTLRPFANALFWPAEVKNQKKPKRTEKVPTVATSDEWLIYHESREQQKRDKLKEKEQRLEKRIQMREEKKIQDAEKKKVQEEKKRIQAEKKLQLEAKKRDLAEKRKQQETNTSAAPKGKKQRITKN